MKLINQYSRCRGIVLLRAGKLLVELWRCPFGEVVEPHTHPNQDSWLMFLCGKCIVGKQCDLELAKEIQVVGKLNAPLFFISATTTHWIKRISSTIWFLNVSVTTSQRVESAAINFQQT